MKNEWILDVLADLKQFARKNGLAALAEQLDDTALTAAAELTSQSEKMPLGVVSDGETAATYTGRHRAGDNA